MQSQKRKFDARLGFYYLLMRLNINRFAYRITEVIDGDWKGLYLDHKLVYQSTWDCGITDKIEPSFLPPNNELRNTLTIIDVRNGIQALFSCGNYVGSMNMWERKQDRIIGIAGWDLFRELSKMKLFWDQTLILNNVTFRHEQLPSMRALIDDTVDVVLESCARYFPESIQKD